MLDVQIPRLFEPLLKGEVDFVEHAPVDCRVNEVLLVISACIASEGKEVAVFGADAMIIQCWNTEWKKTTYGKHQRYAIGSGGLWLLSADGAAPPITFDHVTIIGCHDFDAMPLQSLRTVSNCEGVYSGEKMPSSHWSSQLKVRKLLIDYPTALEQWPDLANQGLPESDPFYPRRMLLQDVEPKFTALAFSVFARKRIRIRTDKPLSLLSSAQQDAAATQFGTPVVPFIKSKLQRRYLALKRRAIAQGKKPWFILVKYRRGGFTSIEQAQSYQLAIERPNSQLVTLADTQAKATRIFRMVSLMAEHDPLRPHQVSDSKTHLEWSNGSLFFIGTAGSRSFARGDTIQRAHWSEAAFSCQGPNQTELILDVKAGLIGAASYGEIVFESTPNRRNWFYTDYIDAKNGESEFTPIFVRWFDDPMNRALPGTYDESEIIETLTAEEMELIQLHDLDIAQIAFRRSAKKTYRALFAQEFPEDDETCFLTSGQCFFNIEHILELIRQLGSEEHGIRRSLPGGYEVLWKPPVLGRQYVAGCDTSEGIPGLDKAGVGVLDKETGEQVAAIHGFFKPELLARLAADLCSRYNNALLGVERNNHGHAVLLALKNLGYFEPHYRGGPLYWHMDIHETKDQIQSGERPDTARAGWNTNQSTRPIMLDGLADAMDNKLIKVHDREFLAECTTFTLQSSGKFEADQGCHDDTVVKWAIAWQMRNVRRPQPEILSV